MKTIKVNLNSIEKLRNYFFVATVLTDELVDEETDGDDVEYEQVEDVLTILLQEVCPDIPFL